MVYFQFQISGIAGVIILLKCIYFPNNTVRKRFNVTEWLVVLLNNSPSDDRRPKKGRGEPSARFTFGDGTNPGREQWSSVITGSSVRRAVDRCYTRRLRLSPRTNGSPDAQRTMRRVCVSGARRTKELCETRRPRTGTHGDMTVTESTHAHTRAPAWPLDPSSLFIARPRDAGRCNICFFLF